MLTRRRVLGERGDKILCWRHSNCTHYDACRRETAECSQRRSEVRAGRLSSRFRLRAYRTVQCRLDQSRVEAYTTGFSQTSIFIPTPFSGRTNGAQWRQGESKFLPCFSQLQHNVVSQNVFHGLQKGQIHPRKHELSKKNFFGKQLRDHYPRALIILALWNFPPLCCWCLLSVLLRTFFEFFFFFLFFDRTLAASASLCRCTGPLLPLKPELKKTHDHVDH